MAAIPFRSRAFRARLEMALLGSDGGHLVSITSFPCPTRDGALGSDFAYIYN